MPGTFLDREQVVERKRDRNVRENHLKEAFACGKIRCKFNLC